METSVLVNYAPAFTCIMTESGTDSLNQHSYGFLKNTSIRCSINKTYLLKMRTFQKKTKKFYTNILNKVCEGLVCLTRKLFNL